MTIQGILLLSSFLGSAVATTYPVGISNCGVQSWIEDAPKRAVTMNQGTTEVMLALGLADSMVGTAYLDDEIWPELAADYARVPVLSEGYPDIDTLMATDPDFLYASYKSAFQAKTEEDSKRIDYFQVVEDGCDLTLPETNATYCRAELHVEGIQTYLQTPYCELADHRPAEVDLKHLYEEIWDVALIFDAFEEAQVLVSNIDDHFRRATNLVETHGSSDVQVFWLDGWDDTTPFVGSCCGSVNKIIEYAGAQNIFSDLGIEEQKSWADANWTDVIERDPDVIVVVDASWDQADEKIYNLCKNEATRNLRAVQNRRFVTVPFSASTLGVRIGQLSFNLAEAFVAMAAGEPLSATDFSEVTITSDGNAGAQAIGGSGVRAYTRLPVFDGVDLEEFCPGGKENNIMVSDEVSYEALEASAQEPKGLPTYGVALIVVFAAGAVLVSGFVVYMIQMEKKGEPVFAEEKAPELS